MLTSIAMLIMSIFQLYTESTALAEILKWVAGIIIILVCAFPSVYTLKGLFGPRIKEYKEANGRGWFWKGLFHEVIPGFGKFIKEINWKEAFLFSDVKDDKKRHRMQFWVYGILLVAVLVVIFTVVL